jgi:ABC-type glycerol-3-phosphate transport system substrate-binding protein
MEESQGRPHSRRCFLQKTGAGLAAATAGGVLGTSPGAYAKAPAQVSRATTTLRIALNGTLSASNTLQATTFEKMHPGSKVEFVQVQAPDWDGFFVKILTMIAGGQSPDMAYIATEGVQQFAAKGLSYPLDDYVKRDKAALMEYFADVHPTLVEAMMYDGSIYHLPLDFNAVDLYYNPILLRQAGFSRPPDNWTKNDFYKIAKAITKKKGNQTTVFGYGWVVRLWGSWTQWMHVAGGDLLEFGRAPGGSWLWETFYKNDPRARGRGGGLRWGQPTANSSANVEALQFVVDLTKEGIAPVASVNGGNALQGLFASGKLGMTPGGGFWAGGLHNAGMKPSQFDVQYWPIWSSGRTHFGTAGYNIMHAGANKDLAWEFIKYASTKAAMTIQLAGNGTTPTRKSMLTAARYAPTGPLHWDVFYPTLDRSGTRAMPAPTYYNQEANVLDKYTTLAVSGTTSIKSALDGMQQELEVLYATNPK